MVRDLYLETEVTTATPQRLRLMLIEEALRQCRAAEQATAQGDRPAAALATTRCRNLVSELLASIRPEQGPVAAQVLRIYLFLYSTLVEIEFAGDYRHLAKVVRVLEEEQLTWLTICQQSPDRPPQTVSIDAAEELAPARVAVGAASSYGQPLPAGAHSQLSLEA